MPNFSRTITVKQDINTVYDFMSDFRNLNKWAEGDDGELITKEPLRLGSVFRVKTHLFSSKLIYFRASIRNVLPRINKCGKGTTR